MPIPTDLVRELADAMTGYEFTSKDLRLAQIIRLINQIIKLTEDQTVLVDALIESRDVLNAFWMGDRAGRPLAESIQSALDRAQSKITIRCPECNFPNGEHQGWCPRRAALLCCAVSR